MLVNQSIIVDFFSRQLSLRIWENKELRMSKKGNSFASAYLLNYLNSFLLEQSVDQPSSWSRVRMWFDENECRVFPYSFLKISIFNVKLIHMEIEEISQ